MAVSPFQVYFSQEARNYSFLEFLVLLATFFWLRGLETNSWWAWLGVGLAGVAGLFCNFTTAFYLLSLGLFPFIFWKENLRRGILAHLSLTGAATGLASGLLLWPKLSTRLDTIKDNFWIPQPDPLIIFRTFYSFIFGVIDPASFIVCFGLLVVLLLIAGWQVSRGLLSPDRPALGLTGWLLLTPMAWLVIVSLLFQPLYLDKALIACAPYFYLLLGWTLFHKRARPAGWVLPGVPLALAVLLGFWLLPSMYSGQLNPVYIARYDGPAVNQYLNQQAQPGDLVVNVSDIGWLPLVYYNEGLPPAKFPLKEYPFPNIFPALLHQLGTDWITEAEITRRNERTWLIFELNVPPDRLSSAAQPYDLNQAIPWMHSPDFQTQTLQKFQSQFQLKSAVLVNRLLLVLFEPTA
jgi:drug/metabolite transporter (DMT)-like permease